MTDTTAKTVDMLDQPIIHEIVPVAKRPLISLNRKQLGIMIAGALAILVVTIAYFVGYKPSRPNAVVASALMKTLQLQSSQLNVLGTVSQGVSYTASGSVSANGAFNLSGSYTIQIGKAEASTIQIETLSTDGQDVYLKAKGLSNLGTVLGSQAAQYGITPQASPLQALDNTWLQIPKSSKDALLKGSQADISSAVSTQLSNDDKDKIAAAYERHPFIVVNMVLADETIQKVANKHYQAGVDKQALLAFADDVKTSVPSLKFDDQQVASIKNVKLPSKPFDIWIAKSSGYVSQVRYASGKTAANFQINLSNYNQPVKVAKPADAKPLFEALSSVLVGGQSPVQ